MGTRHLDFACTTMMLWSVVEEMTSYRRPRLTNRFQVTRALVVTILWNQKSQRVAALAAGGTMGRSSRPQELGVFVVLPYAIVQAAATKRRQSAGVGATRSLAETPFEADSPALRRALPPFCPIRLAATVFRRRQASSTSLLCCSGFRVSGRQQRPRRLREPSAPAWSIISHFANASENDASP